MNTKNTSDTIFVKSKKLLAYADDADMKYSYGRNIDAVENMFTALKSGAAPL